MGKAHKAPSSQHQRTFWVTDHAKERLRTRLTKEEGESGNGTLHRSDDDLSNLIDSLVQDSIKQDAWEDIIDNGEPAMLVDIRRDNNRRDLWAIIKPNTNPRTRATYPKAVVTLLYTRMVTDSKKSGKWNIPDYDDGDVAIGGLDASAKAALSSVTPAPRDKKMPEEKQSTPGPGSILITYNNKNGEKEIEEYVELEIAEKRLNKLRRDTRVDTNSIRVFRELVTEARIIL